MTAATDVRVRLTEERDDPGIVALTEIVYPGTPPWSPRHLASHRQVFPEGQFVAVTGPDERVIGMAASLVILWEDYEMHLDWRTFTDMGMFTNHEPVQGRTLYGAEVMVHPDFRGRGVGKLLYAARRELAERLGLLRIRAGARLRGYHAHADRMSAEEYAIQVVQGHLSDPTLSFQLKQGFDVIAVVPGYLRHDPESLGYAAVIEWLNPYVPQPPPRGRRDPRFARPGPDPQP